MAIAICATVTFDALANQAGCKYSNREAGNGLPSFLDSCVVILVSVW
jgi:hypothetical protein